MTSRPIILMLVCSFLSAASAQTKKLDCEAQKIVLDSAVNNMTMVISPHVLGYPTMDDFEEKYCTPFLPWFRVMSGYKPCLKSFTRTLYSFVGTNVKKIHKQFCVTEDKKVIAFNHLKCMNPKSKPVFVGLGKQLQNFATYISDIPDVNDIIPTFCCGYLNVTTTMIDVMESTCKAQGKPGSGLFMGDLVKNLLNDAVDIICGAHSKPEDCQTPKLKQAMDEMAQRLTVTTEYPHKSVMPQVLKIFWRLDNNINVN